MGYIIACVWLNAREAYAARTGSYILIDGDTYNIYRMRFYLSAIERQLSSSRRRRPRDPWEIRIHRERPDQISFAIKKKKNCLKIRRSGYIHVYKCIISKTKPYKSFCAYKVVAWQCENCSERVLLFFYTHTHILYIYIRTSYAYTRLHVYDVTCCCCCFFVFYYYFYLLLLLAPRASPFHLIIRPSRARIFYSRGRNVSDAKTFMRVRGHNIRATQMRCPIKVGKRLQWHTRITKHISYSRYVCARTPPPSRGIL